MMASNQDAYARARTLIDDVHRQDPLYVRWKEAQAAQASAAIAAMPAEALTVGAADEGVTGQGGGEEEGQDELAYADAMEQWVNALVDKAGEEATDRLAELPGGRDLVRLAARCQHLQRFATPRSTFPEGKAGYLQWRRTLYTKQADTAVQLMAEAGMSSEESSYVHRWVSKTDLKPGRQGGEWGTQLLEDAAVLVFLQDQLHHFAQQHPGYTREKFIDILRKTWRKLSKEGKEAAKGLSMAEPLKGLVLEAIAEATLQASS